MLAVAIVAIVTTVTVSIMLVLGRSRRESSIKRAQQLCGGTVHPAVITRVATAAAQLADDDATAARLGRLAHGLFNVPVPERVQTDLGKQLCLVENRLTHLEHAVDVYEKAAIGLVALAAEAKSAEEPESVSAERLTAALTDLRCLPDDTGVDALAEVADRYAGHAAEEEEHAVVSEEVPTAIGAAKRVAAATRPADPHAAAKATLLADMDRLGLDAEWTDLSSWPEYARRLDGYDERLAGAARAFAERMAEAWDREATVWGEILAGQRVMSGEDHAAEFARLVRELGAATTSYARLVRVELEGSAADATAALRLLDAVPGLLARCEEHLDNGDFAAALIDLADSPLPVARSWRPSEDYESAWQNLANRLGGFTGPHRQQTARWAAVAAAEFRQRVMRLGEAVDTEIATWEAEREHGLDRARGGCQPGQAGRG